MNIVPTTAPIIITITEIVAGNPSPVACMWQLNSAAYHGNYVNANSRLVLINQQTHLISGGSGCGGTAQFVNLTYAPFLDSSVAAPNQVFVS